MLLLAAVLVAAAPGPKAATPERAQAEASVTVVFLRAERIGAGRRPETGKRRQVRKTEAGIVVEFE